MIEKIKAWWNTSGITSIGYAGGFAVAAFAGWWFIAGGCLGIFLYVNYNTIRKIIEDLTTKETEEGGDDSME